MVALLNPAYRREEGVKWWLVFYTLAMFLFVTVYTTMNLHIQSMSFIDNRKEPDYSRFSGPMFYQMVVHKTDFGLVPNVVFNLNNWLADSLLVNPLFDAAITRSGV